MADITGTPDNDTLNGTPDADTIDGLAGDDTLTGGAGDDVLIGGLGMDRLTGGSGSDTFVFRSVGEMPYQNLIVTTLSDQIADFETGIDKIDLSAISGSSITLQLGTFTFRDPVTNVLRGLLSAPNAQAGDVVGLTTGLNIVGGTGDDILVGTALSETFSGGLGNDSIIGGAGDDTISGQDGDDVIRGDAGADIIFGGNGSDVFVYLKTADSTAAATDEIRDFRAGTGNQEADKLDIAALQPSAVSLVRVNATDTVVFATTPDGAFQAIVKANFASQVLQGSSLVTTTGVDIVGHAGDEGQLGTAFADRLFGQGGNDTLHGFAGNDIIVGGAGYDLLFGEAGADTFTYYAATDSLASAYDTIGDFETGIDKLDMAAIATQGIAIVRVGANSVLFANTAAGSFQVGVVGTLQGSDLLAGGSGLDLVGDTNVNDTLIGSAFADRLFGLGGSDTLQGGGGNDLLIGGAGRDFLTGGAGADTFVYQAAADSSAAAFDIISDFQIGIDKIDLRGTGLTNVGIAQQGSDYFVFATGTGLPTLQIGVQAPIVLADILTGPTPGAGFVFSAAPDGQVLDHAEAMNGALFHLALPIAGSAGELFA